MFRQNPITNVNFEGNDFNVMSHIPARTSLQTDHDRSGFRFYSRNLIFKMYFISNLLITFKFTM